VWDGLLDGDVLRRLRDLALRAMTLGGAAGGVSARLPAWAACLSVRARTFRTPALSA